MSLNPQTLEALEVIRQVYGRDTELRSVVQNGREMFWVYDKKGQRVHAATSIGELIRELKARHPLPGEPQAARNSVKPLAANGGIPMEHAISGSERVDSRRAATITGFSVSALLRNVNEGRLKAIKTQGSGGPHGFRYHFDVAELRRWENEQKSQPTHRPRRSKKAKEKASGGYRNEAAAQKARLGTARLLRGKPTPRPMMSSAEMSEGSRAQTSPGMIQLKVTVPNAVRDRAAALVARLQGTALEVTVSRLVEIGLSKAVADLERVLR